MLKRITGILIPLLTYATLVAQDYVMFETQYLKLTNGGHTQLQAGVKKHNDKYHNGENGTTKAYLWYVNTGPYAGQYSWAEGPVKFSDKDKQLSDGHVKDWDNNVGKYTRSHSHIFMMRNEEMTYNPENETVGENILMKRYQIKDGPGHGAAVREAIGSITKVLIKTNAKIARRVYFNRFSNEGQSDLMLVYPFKSWSSFDSGLGLPEGFVADYEKMYGKGSMQKNVGKVLAEHTYGRTHEVMTMVK